MDADMRAEVEVMCVSTAQQYCTALGKELTHEVIPKAVEAAVRAHDKSITAHGGIEMRVDRARWAVRGFVVCVAVMGGAGIERIFSILG